MAACDSSGRVPDDDCQATAHTSVVMDTDKSPSGGSPAMPAGEAVDLIELRLRVSGTELLEGVVGPADAAGIRFHGWVELMSAVETLRRVE
jgi:hypothetical protein